MRITLSLSLALLLGASGFAQGLSFHIPDSNAAAGTCNVIPFGTNASSATWTNQRYQTIATVSDLGATPGFVTGLAFAPCGTGIHYSQSLRITMALVPPGFSLSANGNFDNNLNILAANATVVLDQVDYEWEKTADTWSSIGLDVSFAYDGRSDLLIDILVVGNDAIGASISSSMHRDTRPRLYAVNWVGSPPATGSYGAAAAKMRIQMGCADATTYGRGCNGLELDFSGSTALGASLSVDASGASAFAPIGLNIGTFNGSPFPIDLAIVGFPGCLLRNSTEASLLAQTDASGGFSASFTIPNVPTLEGVRVYYQYVSLDVSSPNPVSVSNGGRTVLGPVCP